MNNYFINLISKQSIDGDEVSVTYDGELIVENIDDQLIYHITYNDANKKIATIILYFVDENQLTVKLYDSYVSGLFELELNTQTSGKYLIQSNELKLDFFLKKIVRDDIDLKLEYDIYSGGELLSNNTLDIEVKKC